MSLSSCAQSQRSYLVCSTLRSVTRTRIHAHCRFGAAAFLCLDPRRSASLKQLNTSSLIKDCMYGATIVLLSFFRACALVACQLQASADKWSSLKVAHSVMKSSSLNQCFGGSFSSGRHNLYCLRLHMCKAMFLLINQHEIPMLIREVHPSGLDDYSYCLLSHAVYCCSWTRKLDLTSDLITFNSVWQICLGLNYLQDQLPLPLEAW